MSGPGNKPTKTQRVGFLAGSGTEPNRTAGHNPDPLLTLTMIGDLTEITVYNSDNDLHLLRVTSARLDGRMPDIPEVEIWRTV